MMPITQQTPASVFPAEQEATPPVLDIGAREVLTHLRMTALGCRAAARTDLFEACALLSLDGEDAKRTFVATLVKCLGSALNKSVVWYRPGVAELSFDEAWLMQCLRAFSTADATSLTFLLRSRVAAHDRRYIGFLLARISEQFTPN
ncbi:hypothetical protein [uncultured Roseobacter sp.]|uniref:hypothetical protein n=1 Tax=uncultured Roseobacter sp. TaxID=114847 RepID=UPI0026298FE4|nr:hypothetical protein [uncultured Roseobacter sp.]